MLPKAKEIDIDFEALGQQKLDRKLKEGGLTKPNMPWCGMRTVALIRRSRRLAQRKSRTTNGRARTAY